jgi:hypothetical protein
LNLTYGSTATFTTDSNVGFNTGEVDSITSITSTLNGSLAQSPLCSASNNLTVQALSGSGQCVITISRFKGSLIPSTVTETITLNKENLSLSPVFNTNPTKVYNGTSLISNLASFVASDSSNPTNLQWNAIGLVNGDSIDGANSVLAGNLLAYFTDKNVRSNETITLGGISLNTVANGNNTSPASNNYNLSIFTNETGSTTPKALALNPALFLSIANTTIGINWDTTTLMIKSGNNPFIFETPSVSDQDGDAITGDNLSLNLANAIAQGNTNSVQSNVPVVVSGLALSGGDANNYILESTTTNTLANVLAYISPTDDWKGSSLTARSSNWTGANGNDALTLTNTTYNSNYGGTLSFNGVNTTAAKTTALSTPLSTTQTLLFWINAKNTGSDLDATGQSTFVANGTPTTSTAPVLFSAGRKSRQRVEQLNLRNGKLNYWDYISTCGNDGISTGYAGAGTAVQSTDTVTPNQWHQVGITVAPSVGSYKITFYIDGKKDGSGTCNGTPAAPSTTNFEIGQSDDTTGGSNWAPGDFNGQIGEATYWNSTLSDAQVTAFYQSSNIYQVPNISISPNAQIFETDTPITPIQITNTGFPFTQETFTPALDPGLTFDTTTNQISGTVSNLDTNTTYTLNVANSFGSSSASFTLNFRAVSSTNSRPINVTGVTTNPVTSPVTTLANNALNLTYGSTATFTTDSNVGFNTGEVDSITSITSTLNGSLAQTPLCSASNNLTVQALSGSGQCVITISRSKGSLIPSTVTETITLSKASFIAPVLPPNLLPSTQISASGGPIVNGLQSIGANTIFSSNSINSVYGTTPFIETITPNSSSVAAGFSVQVTGPANQPSVDTYTLFYSGTAVKTGSFTITYGDNRQNLNDETSTFTWATSAAAAPTFTGSPTVVAGYINNQDTYTGSKTFTINNGYTVPVGGSIHDTATTTSPAVCTIQSGQDANTGTFLKTGSCNIQVKYTLTDALGQIAYKTDNVVADLTKAAITLDSTKISITNKQYDGSTSGSKSQIVVTGNPFIGLANSDQVTIDTSNAIITYDTYVVSNQVHATISGLAIASSGDSAFYTLASTSVGVSGAIGKSPLPVQTFINPASTAISANGGAANAAGATQNYTPSTAGLPAGVTITSIAPDAASQSAGFSATPGTGANAGTWSLHFTGNTGVTGTFNITLDGGSNYITSPSSITWAVTGSVTLNITPVTPVNPVTPIIPVVVTKPIFPNPLPNGLVNIAPLSGASFALPNSFPASNGFGTVGDIAKFTLAPEVTSVDTSASLEVRSVSASCSAGISNGVIQVIIINTNQPCSLNYQVTSSNYDYSNIANTLVIPVSAGVSITQLNKISETPDTASLNTPVLIPNLTAQLSINGGPGGAPGASATLNIDSSTFPVGTNILSVYPSPNSPGFGVNKISNTTWQLTYTGGNVITGTYYLSYTTPTNQSPAPLYFYFQTTPPTAQVVTHSGG